MTDPSWLYSTIAQSSAAIVAIIGGFITASILSSLAEKRSIHKQISEKETSIQAFKEKGKEIYNIYETSKAERFLTSELTNYPDDNIPALDKILAKYPSDYKTLFDTNILKKVFANLTVKQIRAQLFIIKHANKIDLNNPERFLEWVKPEVKTEEYLEIANEYPKYIERQKKSESAYSESSKLPPWALPTFQLNTDKAERKIEEERNQSEQAEIRSSLEKLNDQLSLLSYELQNLNSQLKAFTYPPNLGWGLFVLIILTIFSILVPLFVIFTQAFTMTNSLIVLVLFIVGLIAVFIYIYMLIRTLSRK